MIYSLVSSKQADVGFALYHTSCPHVDVVPIMEDEMVLVLPHRKDASQEAVHPSSLPPEKELLTGSRFNSNLGWGPEFKLWHDRYINPQARPLVTASSISILTGFLEGRDYWTIMPATTANGLKAHYPITVLPLSPAPPGRTLYMLTHESPSCLSAKNTDIFSRYLRDYLNIHCPQGCLME